ncbi:MAG: cation transporter [Acidisphaera sp.]|nr:cation transporter [Acidisphaera sp.]
MFAKGAARNGEQSVDRAGSVAGGSIAVGVLVLALKGAGWWLTGSAALFSDALESIVNVAAAAMAFGALWLAAKPADANHPYGHAKVEFFSAVIEGALIVVAAGVILRHAWTVWQDPHPLAEPLPGITCNIAASLANAVWSGVLLRRGGELRSPALVADGWHLRADVVASATLVAGVALVVATGISALDPALAVGTALYVLVSGFLLIRKSVGGLMDAAPSADIVERIRATVGEHAAGALEAHDLRTRHAGRQTFVDFHLVVPGDMSVADAHDICDRIESALRAEIAGLMITIHVEPDAKAKHHGVVVL